MENFYSSELNVQILIALMKAHGVRKVIISPGTTNIAFGASVRQDPYFELFSSVDERSAAYMACGMAAESGEPVALSCTGATASRNYLPGLTEAFYRKLPVLAITSSQRFTRVGRLEPQIIDRSSPPVDVARMSLTLPLIRDGEEAQAYIVKVNAALLELKRGGGGSVHINLETGYAKDFSVKNLPNVRVIRRYFAADTFPQIPAGARVAITVGSHRPFTRELQELLDKFCAAYDAAVFVDQSSGYKGAYRVLPTIIACQKDGTAVDNLLRPELLIHIGEHSGDYYMLGKLKSGKGQVWRVSPDGELRDTFGRLTNVFEMTESEFFSRYVKDLPQAAPRNGYVNALRKEIEKIYRLIPDLPFSNIWLAATTAHRLPEGCAVHLGVSNTMRSWTFFNFPPSVMSNANLGCRGIDGALSSVLGMSLADKSRIHFCMLGDLTFFYDLNALGNRYVGNNLRILLVNNGRGTEFRMYNHYAARFGDDADPFIAAAGHFGNQSPDLVRHYAQDLGFEYLSASTKQEYLQNVEHFVSPEKFSKPILFEVFTNHRDENDALYTMMHLVKNTQPTQPQKEIHFPKPPFFCGEPAFAGEVLNIFGQYEVWNEPKKFHSDPKKIIVYFGESYPRIKSLFEMHGLREGEHLMDGRKIFAPQQISFTPTQKILPQPKSQLLPPQKARLGFGVMRMPQLDNGQYDVKECVRMVDEYMKSDFRYFDTHPHYCKRLSQSIVRELVVKRYPRDSFLLADKMPWPIRHPSEYEKIFAAELRDCGVDYFDYYLLHAMDAEHFDMHERMGGFEFLKTLKARGLVRRIGFSFHDKPEVLEKILTAHPEMEFVQLQINYLDWEDPFYQARKLYETTKNFGKQITVMEPIKGGSLANLEKFKIPGGLDKKNFAAMALRFVASLDVDIILSGMSALEHVVENRQTLNEPAKLTKRDRKTYRQIIDMLKNSRQIPCTACRYCVAECPKKIPIPDILSLMNLCGHTGENDKTYLGRFKRNYARYTFQTSKASDCIACGACKRRCPQKIDIPEHMREAAKLFENK